MTIKQRLFSFKGRLNRRPYFFTSAALIVGLITTIVILVAFTSSAPKEVVETGSNVKTALEFSPLGNVIYVLASFTAFYFSMAMHAKRLHDLGKSGWWAVCAILPVVNLIFAAYLIFAKGTGGDNRFGPDPLQPTDLTTKTTAAKKIANPTIVKKAA